MFMKALTYLTIALLFTILQACQSEPKFVRVDDSEVDQAHLEIATELSKAMLTAQKAGGYYKLTNKEATEAMVYGLSRSLQKRSYKQIKIAFGDYRDLHFDHMMRPTDGTLFEVYRFRGEFNPGAEVEVRTVLDANGRLAGFFVKPWRDKF